MGNVNGRKIMEKNRRKKKKKKNKNKVEEFQLANPASLGSLASNKYVSIDLSQIRKERRDLKMSQKTMSF